MTFDWENNTHTYIIYIALRGGESGGVEILLGGGFFLTGGDFSQGFFFRSFEAFVMLKLIFHIYWTSINENWYQTLI